MSRVICILGTTGVGKTRLSIELAKKFDGEIINADAMQMYKGLEITTNKATIQEMQEIPHHLLSHLAADAEYTVSDFVKDALEKITQIHSRKKVPIIVGGTNYYIQSLLWTKSLVRNEYDIKKIDTDLKNKLEALFTEYSSKTDQELDDDFKLQMHQTLHSVDPEASFKFHPNNHRRVFRSLQMFFETGKTATEIYKSQQGQQLLRFPTCFFWLAAESEILDMRLDDRVDQMVKSGMLDEVQGTRKALEKKWPNLKMNYAKGGIFQAIGFKEFEKYFESKTETDYKKAIELTKIATRQYARKQVHWISKKFTSQALEIMALEPSKCAFYVLDATDLDKWGHSVSETAASIYDSFMDSRSFTSKPKDLSELAGKLLEMGPIEQTWQKFTCEQCVDDKGDYRTFYGSHEWQDHLRSKRHKKIKLYHSN